MPNIMKEVASALGVELGQPFKLKGRYTPKNDFVLREDGLFAYLKAKKMRLAPSIDDLIEHADISWTSPDGKSHKQFAGYFDNYRGKVGIDKVIFDYVVRVGHGKSWR